MFPRPCLPQSIERLVTKSPSTVETTELQRSHPRAKHCIPYWGCSPDEDWAECHVSQATWGQRDVECIGSSQCHIGNPEDESIRHSASSRRPAKVDPYVHTQSQAGLQEGDSRAPKQSVGSRPLDDLPRHHGTVPTCHQHALIDDYASDYATATGHLSTWPPRVVCRRASTA